MWYADYAFETNMDDELATDVADDFVIVHINVRRFLKKVAELNAYIALLPARTQLICINET